VLSDLFADYIAVLIATILGFLLVAGALIGNRILAPRQPTRTKAVTFVQIGEQAFWEMMVFILILAFGLLYAWKKGVLSWRS
jgi:NADH:ubiquinone oxidoreductase subunit 3 (subunit A)